MYQSKTILINDRDALVSNGICTYLNNVKLILSQILNHSVGFSPTTTFIGHIFAGLWLRWAIWTRWSWFYTHFQGIPVQWDNWVKMFQNILSQLYRILILINLNFDALKHPLEHVLLRNLKYISFSWARGLILKSITRWLFILFLIF